MTSSRIVKHHKRGTQCFVFIPINGTFILSQFFPPLRIFIMDAQNRFVQRFPFMSGGNISFGRCQSDKEGCFYGFIPCTFATDVSCLSIEKSVAIIGTREPSDYSVVVAEEFSSFLAERGVNIISGFAMGIDTAAHRSAMRAGGSTVAVMGCGLEYDYPRGRNRSCLREKF